MSEEIYFSRNYSDLCVSSGTGAGFQFEFSCQRCYDTWRSPFEAWHSGRAADWLQRGVSAAWGVFGRAGSEASTAASGLATAGYGRARDTAFTKAIQNAEGHFNRCGRCTNYVCGRCFDTSLGLCATCAPDTAAEAAAATVRGRNDAVSERAMAAGAQEGARYDVNRPLQLVCPQCSAETHGARFCPGCGHRLAQTSSCGSCQATVPAGSAFCPDCGTRQ
ncbi:zinc ribbon domain-containing protein [Embleya sp. AB8]|uniref:zinc ribbon domain-containing protein n=1 Tax=Embleya sp. AB8 TaxID=3156304 RepID=UPI003C71ECCF